MSYTKNTWATGDTITADKLNHIENGIAAGGAMVVNATYDESTLTYTLNKTWQEIHDALAAGVMVIVIGADSEDDAEQWVCYKAWHDILNQKYIAELVQGYNPVVFIGNYSSESADGYPSYTED